MSLYGSLQSKTAFINHGKRSFATKRQVHDAYYYLLKARQGKKPQIDEMTISRSRRAEQIGIYRIETRAENLLSRLAEPSAFSTDDRYTREAGKPRLLASTVSKRS